MPPMGDSMAEEIAVTILGLALKLYPEIAALVAGAKADGSLPTHVAAAVEASMPEPGPAAVALQKIEAM